MRYSKMLYLGFINALFMLLFSTALWLPGVARAKTLETTRSKVAQCAASGNITSQSLLVVMLDRSGSLIYRPGATDPDGYSTSVTKALADLWPGQMAVIPFSNASTPVIGPFPMSDPTQRQNLKDAVQNYPIGGNTPLDPAMQQALNLLKNAPAGSRAIIVTDGSPEPPVLNGVNQSDDIRQKLIPQFCADGKPISAFGLALNLTQPDGQTANALLGNIADGTGGIYTNVRNSHELAHVVVQLYAQWQHLVFLPTQLNGSVYTVNIDTYARRVTFVAFRSGESFAITLNGPDGQPVPGQSVQRSTDRHYEIDNMALSDINQPGTYSIDVSGDSQAQVYALVETRLHVALLQPSTRTIAYIGQPLEIQAELLDGTTPVIPKPNEATINAQVIVTVPGQAPSTINVELVQESNSGVFSRKITLNGPPGQVHVQIEAVYLQVPVEASQAQITIPLEKAPVIIPPTPPCGANVSCYWTRYHTVISGGLIALLLLLLLLLLLHPRKSRGWKLVQNRHEVDLGTMGRPLLRKAFSKSILSSQELESHGGLDFGGARFALNFKSGGVEIVASSNDPKVIVRQGRQPVWVKTDMRDVTLAMGDSIEIPGCAKAVLTTST